ncbi:DUF4202 domain-containing protein [Cohaesibacter celericrescens]|uniref:DUF4202 domain-containing protein n=1 Tax=Cohaesibacter celericrescens TaxID=2067669 RepID=A0A2N5XQW7_9HYPH|nr:DUF4202 domain-containing protein [Cohaesibacter celericrescens]PLW76916.1 DUF4202 domain-containing protein [Cohaesibacter celericrescens]
MSAFDSVLEAIDQANARDPRHCEEEGSAPVPLELLYGIRMSLMGDSFAPDADELVRIAARGQHIERWIIPRDEYPRDKSGYFRWRNELKRHHSKRVSGIMAEHGYSQEDQAIVADILLKKNIKRDARTQTVEDLACLVFLKYYAVSFAKGHDPQKVVGIIAKTLPKMSEKAHAFVADLSLDTGLLEAIEAAKIKLAAIE